MKTIPLEHSQLADCVSASQQEQVIVTQAGRPVAVIVGLQGLDDEQLATCRDSSFWKLISERRREATLSREELERQIARVP